jgi:hypothetical protein
MTSVLAQLTLLGRRLVLGPQRASADAASVAVAAIPALGPLPPLLVRARLDSDARH